MFYPSDPAATQVSTVLVAFLKAFGPDGLLVFNQDDNRVSEPSTDTFVSLTNLWRSRMGTNFDKAIDCSFMATTQGSTLSVGQMLLGGPIEVDTSLSAPGLAQPYPQTTIAAQLSGTPGGVGTYQLSAAVASDVTTSTKMAAGQIVLMQPTEIAVQINVQSAHGHVASDIAKAVTTLFDDDYAFRWFVGWTDPNNNGASYDVTPLWADDPKKIVFDNQEQWRETIYAIEAHFQVNAQVSPPMQFADQLKVTTVQADQQP
jgi:hypothetical protein